MSEEMQGMVVVFLACFFAGSLVLTVAHYYPALCQLAYEFLMKRPTLF